MRRSVDERPHRDVNERAVPHHGEEERAARAAARVVRVLLADEEEFVPALVISSFSRSMPANGLNAEPVAARQREQWQFAAYPNSSATVYWTAPQ